MSFDFASFMLGPSLVASTTVLNWLGFPPLFIAAVSGISCLAFAYRHVISAEVLVRLLTSLIVNIFFRDIDSRNTHNIPEEGPVLFVCAPHANQFLDPAVMQQFVPRTVAFLIAAKSMRQPIIGDLARAQRSIPVERPQDLAQAVPGKVKVHGRTVTAVAGSGAPTDFTTVFTSTDSILLASEVIHISSLTPTAITLKSDPPCGDADSLSFKRVPRVPQDTVFGAVWDRLAAGECVGIFPEGGSHDRTELLPLKAGVAIMALGAAAKYPGLDVKIVCVGMNYFHGHRFRGRAYVEFSDPFGLPAPLVEQYRQGGAAKIAACNTFLDVIKDGLKSVTVCAPSWDHLQMLWAVRRLYQPEGVRLPPKLTVILIRRFAEAYEQVKDDPQVKDVVEQVMGYNQLLRTYGLRDHQVALTEYTRARALFKLLWRLLRAVLLVLLTVPGIILNLPILIITRSIARKKAGEALKSSTVKVQAKDVVASWKVLTSLSLVPLVLIVYPALAAIVGWLLGYSPLVAWGNFAVLQPIMMWAGVRAGETGMQIIRSLNPLFLAVTDSSGSGLAAVRATRDELRLRVRALVDEMGPRVYGDEFRELRLFSPDMLRKATAAASRVRKANTNIGGVLARSSNAAAGTSERNMVQRASQIADSLAPTHLHPRSPIPEGSEPGPRPLAPAPVAAADQASAPASATVSASAASAAPASGAASGSGAPSAGRGAAGSVPSASAAHVSDITGAGEALGTRSSASIAAPAPSRGRTPSHAGSNGAPSSGRQTPDSDSMSEISISEDGVLNLRLDPALLAKLATGVPEPEEYQGTFAADALNPLLATESEAAESVGGSPALRPLPGHASGGLQDGLDGLGGLGELEGEAGSTPRRQRMEAPVRVPASATAGARAMPEMDADGVAEDDDDDENEMGKGKGGSVRARRMSVNDPVVRRTVH